MSCARKIFRTFTPRVLLLRTFIPRVLLFRAYFYSARTFTPRTFTPRALLLRAHFYSASTFTPRALLLRAYVYSARTFTPCVLLLRAHFYSARTFTPRALLLRAPLTCLIHARRTKGVLNYFQYEIFLRFLTERARQRETLFSDETFFNRVGGGGRVVVASHDVISERGVLLGAIR